MTSVELPVLVSVLVVVVVLVESLESTSFSWMMSHKEYEIDTSLPALKYTPILIFFIRLHQERLWGELERVGWGGESKFKG